jgi:hypothetical protein
MVKEPASLLKFLISLPYSETIFIELSVKLVKLASRYSVLLPPPSIGYEQSPPVGIG